jgi:hypothetical protein
VTDRIDAYLDDLADRLPGTGRETRRALAEAESHLRDASDHLRARGMTAEDAEQRAIADFGTPGQVARALRLGGGSLWSLAGELAGLGARLVAVGLIAIGVSAAAARVLAGFLGTSAIFGLPTGAHPAAASCAHWLAVQPGTTTCMQAGTLEASDDITLLHGALGVLGVLLGIAVLIVSRSRRPSSRMLPPTLGPTIAATAFLGAAAGLFAFGVGNVVIENVWGRGLWFVEAAVSLVAAAIASVLLIRALMRGAEPRRAVR